MSNLDPRSRAILDDLYSQDPELRTKESELIPLVDKLLKLRPNEEPSTHFRQQLRQDLLAAHAKQYSTPHSSSSFFERMTSRFSFKYLAIPIGAVAVVALVLTNLPNMQRQTAGTSLALNTNVGTITRVAGANAFGPLAPAFDSTPRQGAGGGTAMNSAVVNPAYAVTDKRIATSLLPFQTYKYTYTGELPTWNNQLDVYKRVKGMAQNNSLIQSLAQSTHGLIDLGKLNGLQLQSFTLNQAIKYGYSVSVDLVEAVVNINQNYQQWPHPEASCTDDACFQQYRLKEADVPADSELIQIANDFLKANGISTEKYGQPIVNSDWRTVYAATADKTNFYISDSMTVIYPTMINGQVAYDEGGQPNGLMVNVNVREKRVDNVSNLTTNNFESSSYTAETDKSRILSVMERGGLYGFVAPDAEKVTEVELQNPEIVLQRVWLPINNGQSSDELLIPSLRFEVKSQPKDSYLSKYVFVPLVKDVLDSQRPGNVRILY